MPNLDATQLERLTREIFAARGVPADDAAWIATMLVRANLRGHDSHGVIRIPQYVASLTSGTLNPTPQMKLVVDTPTIAILDGDGGFGRDSHSLVRMIFSRPPARGLRRQPCLLWRSAGVAGVHRRTSRHLGRES